MTSGRGLTVRFEKRWRMAGDVSRGLRNVPCETLPPLTFCFKDGGKPEAAAALVEGDGREGDDEYRKVSPFDSKLEGSPQPIVFTIFYFF